MRLFFFLPLLLLLSSSIFAQSDFSGPSPDSLNGRNTGDILHIVDEPPQFPGGMDKLKKYLADKLVYPQKAIEEGVQGKVFVRFVVDEKGRIFNVRITRGVHPLLDQEAMRVIKKMPRWKPAKNNGRKVKCYYNLPVSFKLT